MKILKPASRRPSDLEIKISDNPENDTIIIALSSLVRRPYSNETMPVGYGRIILSISETNWLCKQLLDAIGA